MIVGAGKGGLEVFVGIAWCMGELNKKHRDDSKTEESFTFYDP